MTEIPLKQWRAEEAARLGVRATAVNARLARGWYPKLQLRRVNARTVFVVEAGEAVRPPRKARVQVKRDKRLCEGCDRSVKGTMLRAPAKQRLCFKCWVRWLAKNETEANERQKCYPQND